YGNRTSLLGQQGTRPHLLLPDALQGAGWMFEVVFDYGEGHYEELPPDDPAALEESHRFARVLATTDRPSGPVRSDPFSTYRAGFEVRTYRLCRRVLMFHHFAEELGNAECLVRSTDFTYADSPVASFITEVTRSGYVRRPDEGRPDRYLKKSVPPLAF